MFRAHGALWDLKVQKWAERFWMENILGKQFLLPNKLNETGIFSSEVSGNY